jgi:peptidoglycan/LPS O-acetylase OafA/YrhL
MRFSGLDALRGIAALGVALYHLGWCYALNLDAHFSFGSVICKRRERRTGVSY